MQRTFISFTFTSLFVLGLSRVGCSKDDGGDGTTGGRAGTGATGTDGGTGNRSGSGGTGEAGEGAIAGSGGAQAGATGTGGAGVSGGGSVTGGTAGALTGGAAGALTGGAAGATGGSTWTGGTGTGTGGSFTWGNTQCTDGLDNDNDGMLDAFDMHCIGPMDNDEGSFATGISGDNSDPHWQDCFFDGNSGAGDDDCRYHTECITGERPPTDSSCDVVQACVDYCGTFIPNGCDCFGCCEVHVDGVPRTISLGLCTDPADVNTCPTCTQSTECVDTCDHCELCLGKNELPADCLPGTGGTGGSGGTPSTGGTAGTGQVCSDGRASCDLNTACPDPSREYCLTGCCFAIAGG